MINLIRPNIVENIGGLLRIREISIMEKKSGCRLMWIRINVINSSSVESASSSDNTVNFVATGKQQLS
jgi:hypothetical protein